MSPLIHISGMMVNTLPTFTGPSSDSYEAISPDRTSGLTRHHQDITLAPITPDTIRAANEPASVAGVAFYVSPGRSWNLTLTGIKLLSFPLLLAEYE